MAATLSDHVEGAGAEGVGVGIVHPRDRLAREPQIGRTLVLRGEVPNDGAGLHVVSRLEDRHIRDRAHERHVFESHLALAVLADGHARVGAHEAHVGAGVAHADADRVVATRQEAREGAGEGYVPAQGEACGDAHHIGLGDAHLEEALRERGAEDPRLRGLRQVGVERHDVRYLGADLREDLSEAGPGGLAGCRAQ